MSTDHENPGQGYGFKTGPDYQMGKRDSYGPPWPPEAVSNGTKPQERSEVVAAQNRVRAYLVARAAVNRNDLITSADPAHAFGADLYASDLKTLLGPDYWLGDGGPPETEPTVTVKRGPGGDDEPTEVHESFGYTQVNNVSATGHSLFGSDITHQHFVVLRIGRMERTRGNKRDHLFPKTELIEVAFSKAQWGQMVSSFGQGSGVPCTILRTQEQGLIPQAPHAPRLEHSTDEVYGATEALVAKIGGAADELLEAFNNGAGRKDLRRLIEDVKRHADQAPGNAVFAAKSMGEHVENVVAAARADIEAMVDDRARQLGIDPGEVIGDLRAIEAPAIDVPELEEGDPLDA